MKEKYTGFKNFKPMALMDIMLQREEMVLYSMIIEN